MNVHDHFARYGKNSRRGLGKILVLLLLTFNGLAAQKIVKKSFMNPAVSFIKIDAGNCFQIAIDTSNGHDIIVEATIDGEYKKDLELSIENVGSTIEISTGFQPSFVAPNDKLSAHKVISISLRIMLPKNKTVHVYGTSCNVLVSGAYRFLGITLNDGKCILNNVTQMVEITTQSGDIIVHSAGAEISASSKYGNVETIDIPKGDNRFKLTTITGDIHLRKTE